MSLCVIGRGSPLATARGWPRGVGRWFAEASDAHGKGAFPCRERNCDQLLTRACRVPICEECRSSFAAPPEKCEICGQTFAWVTVHEGAASWPCVPAEYVGLRAAAKLGDLVTCR